MALSMSRPAYDNILQRDQASSSIGEYTADNKSFPMSNSESHKRRAHDRDEGDLIDLSDVAKDNQAMSSDTEMDSEPAAKVQRGGGRRKQSKPLRMCASTEPANDVEPMEMKLESTLLSSAFNESLHCDLCNEFCANERSLKDHIRLAHDTSQSDTADGRPVPTKYHQLGKELGQELYTQSVADDISMNKQIGSSDGRYERPVSAFEKELIAKSEHGWERYEREEGEKCRDDNRKSSCESPQNAENSSVKPDSKNYHADALGTSSSFLNRSSTEESGVRRPSDPNNQEGEAGRVIWDPSGKGRIFHPDAYCEICDREFCNKYFLKTHKANKHGIYDTSLAVPDIPGGGINNMFSIMNLLQHQQQQQQQQQFQQQQQDFSMSARNLLFPPLLPKLTAAASAKLPEKMVSTSPNAMLSTAMKGSEDAYESSQSNALDKEDYCDFCQKHFCNKYYLRKHKLDVHGLGSGAGPSAIPFSSSQDNNAKRSSSSGAFSSAGNGLDASSSALASLGMSRVSGPTTSSSASSVPPGPMPYLHNMANLMFLNPFAIIPPLFQTTGGMPTYGSGGAANGLAFPPGLISADGEVKNLSTGSNGPSSMATDVSMSGIQHNILQSLGMNNPEAYLEMCRKEISKSYLMRNATPESSSSKRNLFSGEFAGFGGEASGSSSRNPTIKTEPSSEKPLSDMSDVYKKTFSSLSSLQGGKWDGLNNSLAEELTRLEKFNGMSASENFDKSIFNNMVAAKLIDRVLCDICNKEVCNKYFLKTHKIKVHGWDPGTSDFEAAQDAVATTTPIKRQVPSPPPLMPINFPSSSKDVGGFDQLREEELVKMGIDPEAYCDICKKEFCSKYFLKTHRQNIHGIKPDGGLRMPDGLVGASPGSSGGNNFGLPMDYSSASTAPASSSTGATSVSTTHLLSGAQHLNLFAGMNHQMNSSIYNNSLQLQTSLAAAAAADSGSRSGSEKRMSGFKWKEPGNAARVMCDICNKDLCNKYFLKTHMLKCHGINFDTVTGLRTNDTSSMSQPFFNEGGNDSSDDGASGHSGNLSSSRGGDGQGLSSLQRVQRWENGFDGDEKSHRASYDGERRKCQSPMNLVLTESNHVESKFRTSSTENQARHASKNAELAGALHRNGSSSNEDASGGDSSQPDENSTAGSPPILTARDSQRRQDNSFLARHSSDSDADKIRTSINENGPKPSQNNCEKSGGISSEAATKAAIANHIRNQQNRKMFCCALCQERFASRLECDIHTAKEHSQLRGFDYALTNFGDSENNSRITLKTGDSANNDITDSSRHGINLISPSSSSSTTTTTTTNNASDSVVSRFGSNSAPTSGTISSNTAGSVSPPTTTISIRPTSTSYAQPTEPFDRSKIPMQLFNLCEETEGGRHFLPSVVCLPTLCPVTKPMSVTFTLTPVSQP